MLDFLKELPLNERLTLSYLILFGKGSRKGIMNFTGLTFWKVDYAITKLVEKELVVENDTPQKRERIFSPNLKNFLISFLISFLRTSPNSNEEIKSVLEDIDFKFPNKFPNKIPEQKQGIPQGGMEQEQEETEEEKRRKAFIEELKKRPKVILNMLPVVLAKGGVKKIDDIVYNLRYSFIHGNSKQFYLQLRKYYTNNLSLFIKYISNKKLLKAFNVFKKINKKHLLVSKKINILKVRYKLEDDSLDVIRNGAFKKRLLVDLNNNHAAKRKENEERNEKEERKESTKEKKEERVKKEVKEKKVSISDNHVLKDLNNNQVLKDLKNKNIETLNSKSILEANKLEKIEGVIEEIKRLGAGENKKVNRLESEFNKLLGLIKANFPKKYWIELLRVIEEKAKRYNFPSFYGFMFDFLSRKILNNLVSARYPPKYLKAVLDNTNLELEYHSWVKDEGEYS
jgi:hypothetical protein